MEAIGCIGTKGKKGSQIERIVLVKVAGAKASTTEEPREGKLHAGFMWGHEVTHVPTTTVCYG